MTFCKKSMINIKATAAAGTAHTHWWEVRGGGESTVFVKSNRHLYGACLQQQLVKSDDGVGECTAARKVRTVYFIITEMLNAEKKQKLRERKRKKKVIRIVTNSADLHDESIEMKGVSFITFVISIPPTPHSSVPFRSSYLHTHTKVKTSEKRMMALLILNQAAG